SRRERFFMRHAKLTGLTALSDNEYRRLLRALVEQQSGLYPQLHAASATVDGPALIAYLDFHNFVPPKPVILEVALACNDPEFQTFALLGFAKVETGLIEELMARDLADRVLVLALLRYGQQAQQQPGARRGWELKELPAFADPLAALLFLLRHQRYVDLR